jgi:hypothetical protein
VNDDDHHRRRSSVVDEEMIWMTTTTTSLLLQQTPSSRLILLATVLCFPLRDRFELIVLRCLPNDMARRRKVIKRETKDKRSPIGPVISVRGEGTLLAGTYIIEEPQYLIHRRIKDPRLRSGRSKPHRSVCVAGAARRGNVAQ